MQICNYDLKKTCICIIEYYMYKFSYNKLKLEKLKISMFFYAIPSCIFFALIIKNVII